jgi:hypothetical protein
MAGAEDATAMPAAGTVTLAPEPVLVVSCIHPKGVTRERLPVSSNQPEDVTRFRAMN